MCTDKYEKNIYLSHRALQSHKVKGRKKLVLQNEWDISFTISPVWLYHSIQQCCITPKVRLTWPYKQSITHSILRPIYISTFFTEKSLYTRNIRGNASCFKKPSHNRHSTTSKWAYHWDKLAPNLYTAKKKKTAS